jgi:type I restriction enzyme M protein
MLMWRLTPRCFERDQTVPSGKIPGATRTTFEIAWKNTVAKRCAYKYVPASKQEHRPLFEEIVQEFHWTSGRSMAAKRKQIQSLHAALEQRFPRAPILEISTKSPNPPGVALSAFNLRLPREHGGTLLESAYQAAKVFQRQGSDGLNRLKHLEAVAPQEAKHAALEFRREDLLHFEYEGETWPAHVESLFYDYLFWLSLSASPALLGKITAYEIFTDIEFNKIKPGFQAGKSFNTQARSAAIAKRIVTERPFSSRTKSAFDWFYALSSKEREPEETLF